MTMTMEAPTSHSATSPAERLRITTTAVRISLRWLGVRKTLTPEQKNQAAETFNAEGEFLSARKKLLDTRHSAYKGATAVRGKIVSFWRALTLPYPEPGIRLIKQAQVEPFNQQMLEFRDELQEAVSKLDNHYGELKMAARRRLGELYDPADYPSSLEGLFSVEWDFPSVEPPEYLLQLSPDIYEQERNRVAARFEEAVQLTEQAFIGELAKLVSHLTERLSGTENGQKKIFRDSAVQNMKEFFDRFRQLSIRSNPELDALVQQAQSIVAGQEPQALRDNDSLRQQVTTQLSRVQASLDGMMIDAPRRRIIRSAPSSNGASHETGH
jgi:hypothetical protein